MERELNAIALKNYDFIIPWQSTKHMLGFYCTELHLLFGIDSKYIGKRVQNRPVWYSHD